MWKTDGWKRERRDGEGLYWLKWFTWKQKESLAVAVGKHPANQKTVCEMQHLWEEKGAVIWLRGLWSWSPELCFSSYFSLLPQWEDMTVGLIGNSTFSPGVNGRWCAGRAHLSINVREDKTWKSQQRAGLINNSFKPYIFLKHVHSMKQETQIMHQASITASKPHSSSWSNSRRKVLITFVFFIWLRWKVLQFSSHDATAVRPMTHQGVEEDYKPMSWWLSTFPRWQQLHQPSTRLRKQLSFIFSEGSPTPTHDKAVSRWAGAAWFLTAGTRAVNTVLLT